MAIRSVLHLGHPFLRERARELSREELASPEIQALIDDLIETMRHANGAGIAATQVHEPVRIFVVEVKDNPRYPYKPNIPLTVVVNPRIEPLAAETFENYEGCLSVPNLRGLVDRFAEVRVTGLTREGEPFERIARGLTAGTFQHETDHLDGVLFVDRVKDTKSLCTWAEFDRFHKQAFVDRIVPFVKRMGG